MDEQVGTDILQAIAASEPAALWPARGATEFWCVIRDFGGSFLILIRLGYITPSLNHGSKEGCQPYWVGLDRAFANGAPIDVVYFEGNCDLMVLALNVTKTFESQAKCSCRLYSVSKLHGSNNYNDIKQAGESGIHVGGRKGS